MTSVVKNIKSILPGFIVALIVALSSMFLAKFVPALGAAPIAIFLGMFVGNIFLNQKVFQRGYKFSESDLLSYSIVLLGATLSISTISEIKGIELRSAFDIYYSSKLAEQIEKGSYGIENMDAKYLAEDLIENEPELLEKHLNGD